MIVCLCKNITEKQIRQTIIDKGVGTMRDLSSQLGLGSRCGKCGPYAKDMLKMHQLKDE